MVDPRKLNADVLFEMLSVLQTESYLKKYLTREIKDKLKNKRTVFGGTFEDCIRPGCLHASCISGVYACDPDAYVVFAEIFQPVIRDYHRLQSPRHPPLDLGCPDNYGFRELDREGRYILSTRVRLGRNLENYGFPPVMSLQDRLDIENIMKKEVLALGGDLAGKYQSLCELSDEQQERLRAQHMLFQQPPKVRMEVGAFDFWPQGRGMFSNDEGSFLVWINEEDHVRVISLERGSNLTRVWERLAKGMRHLDERLPFSRHQDLGFVTFCPTNLGTSLRASVHVKIPLLAKQADFIERLDNINIQVRGVSGEYSALQGDVYDVSNKRRLGLTEIQLLREMWAGVEKVIHWEKQLEEGQGYS